MSIKLAALLGWKFAHSPASTALVRAVSVISHCGLIIGISGLITGLSIVNGFEQEFSGRLLGIVPHIQLHTTHANSVPWAALEQELTNCSTAIMAINSYIEIEAIVKKGTKFMPALIKGVDPDKPSPLNDIKKYSHEDSWQQLTHHQGGIILGRGLAQKIGATIGKKVTLLTHHPTDVNATDVRTVNIAVCGILTLNSSLDHRLALVSTSTAQSILAYEPWQASGLVITLHDPMRVHEVRATIEPKLPHTITCTDWTEEYGAYYQDIELIRSMILFTFLLVIIISSYNVVSVLMLGLNLKTKELAILRSMGAHASTICYSTMFYGLFKNLKAIGSGVILAVIISKHLTAIFRFIEKRFPEHVLDYEAYFIDFIPAVLKVRDVAWVVLITLLLGVIASLYPAIRSRQNAIARNLNS